MKKLKLCFLAAKIEWHWWFIRRTRKRGSSLLSREVSFSSQKLFLLNRRLSAHSVKVIKIQNDYQKLAGTIL
ncbi:MAG: hypothetical protein CVU91_00705 [Firmicutes bacterium HGW-Firmicutes-16]|nr:MAG: hypothetical protein CVU91_00705 [Firmicutes bacterium HGW-Firmicutes-16]